MHGGDSQGMYDHERSGLPCRFDIRCAFVAQVLDDAKLTLSNAAGRRDAHELDAHSYTHVAQTQINYPFTARMSSGGRSTLRRRVPRVTPENDAA